MVAAIAFVPSPPLLLKALGGGPIDLRTACVQAISALDGLDIVVIGAAMQDGWVTGTIDAAPWGARGPAAPDGLPLALAVGATLLGDRPHTLYGVQQGWLPAFDDRVGLLVVGDGSARRTEKAPGHLDERAAAFDEQVVAALRSGDPAQLASLNPVLGTELLVGGLSAWRAVAAVGGSWLGAVLYDQAPYGVGYVVATWTLLPKGKPDAALLRGD